MNKLAQLKTAIADCITSNGVFKASVHNASPTSIFVKTDEALNVGQEIAMTIQVPKSEDTIKATGQIVKTASDGVDVEFTVFFST
jgi:Tfp pilus assembly protein PilZ